MNDKRLGRQTVALAHPPSVLSFSNMGGKFEGQGPLADFVDEISNDSFFGEKTWEKAESAMQKTVLQRALEKAELTPEDLDYILAGDLLNQCIGSSFGLRDFRVPFYGLYGACSTMGESLSLASLLIDGGYADRAAALTSSHFCTAERQYRMPVPYGSQRTPTAQWTTTAAGCTILGSDGPGPYVTHVTCGRIVDKGITDANNMGAAMAPAAYDTLSAFFRDTGYKPADFDLILTGDLGELGHAIVRDFFQRDGVDMGYARRSLRLRLLCLRAQRLSPAQDAGGQVEDHSLRPHRGAALPHLFWPGGVHPLHLPRRAPERRPGVIGQPI